MTTRVCAFESPGAIQPSIYLEGVTSIPKKNFYGGFKVGTFFKNHMLLTAHSAKFEVYVGDGICVNCEFPEKNNFFQIFTEYRKIVQI